MDVKLYTRDGAGFVHAATIPPFNEPPDVVFWGTRTFRRVGPDGDGHDLYVEAWTYAIVDLPRMGAEDPESGHWRPVDISGADYDGD